jgi:arylformamidase
MSQAGTVTGKPVYRGMDQAGLDAAYNNTAAVVDSGVRLALWSERSAIVRAEAKSRLDLVYGPRPRNRIDYFPTDGRGGPLFVFLHGGYWQRNSKEMFAFLSDGPRAYGIKVAVIGYTLAPEARLSEIVKEVRQALDFLSENASNLEFDRGGIFVGGWSAGAHLAAVVSDHPSVRGGLAISGIFDLEPIALSYINEQLRLDAKEIGTLSPLRNVSIRHSPLQLFVGASELPELRRQSAVYAEMAKKQGLPVALTELPSHNHFSILDELSGRGGLLARELARLVENGRGPGGFPPSPLTQSSAGL